jgi:hypothetical protein
MKKNKRFQSEHHITHMLTEQLIAPLGRET